MADDADPQPEAPENEEQVPLLAEQVAPLRPAEEGGQPEAVEPNEVSLYKCNHGRLLTPDWSLSKCLLTP